MSNPSPIETDLALNPKVVFLNSVFLFAGIVAFGMGFIRWQASAIMGAIDFVFALCAFALVYYLNRHKERVDAISSAALVLAYGLFTAIYLLAPYNTTRISLFFLLSASAFFLKGRQAGLIWLIFILLTIVVGHFLSGFDTAYSHIDIVTASLYLLALFFIFINYEKFKEKVNQRDRDKEVLRLSEERFRTMVDNGNDIISIISDTGMMRFISPSVEPVLGFEPGEMIGKHVNDLIHPDEQPKAATALANALAHPGGETVERYEFRIKHKDGSYRDIEMVGRNMIGNPVIGGIVLNGRDITERKLAESKLENAYQELERTSDASLNIMADLSREIAERKRAEAEVLQLNAELEEKVIARTAQLERARLEVEQASRGKDEFLAAISHELKTPLNHILGFSDLLKEGLAGELNAEQKSMAQDIFDAGSKQLALVNSLIELARLQAGKAKLHAKPEDTARMLGEIATQHAAKAKAAGLTFAVEVEQGLGEMSLDREVVAHLLDQLFANAFKFTPSGGKVSLTARRVPRTGVAAPVRIEADEYLELAVADNGSGVAPEILPRLFQPFVQGEGGLNRSHGGTGVGLTLVRLLAELHGGGSGVESKPGTGAKFLVWLPGKQQP